MFARRTGRSRTGVGRPPQVSGGLGAAYGPSSASRMTAPPANASALPVRSTASHGGSPIAEMR